MPRLYRITVAVLSAALVLAGRFVIAQDVTSGQWNGVASRQGADLPMQLRFHNAGRDMAGVITIPTLGAFRLPLKHVSQNGPNVRFQLASDDGTFQFNGTVRADSLTGSWNLFGFDSQVSMTRVGDEPLPYRTEDVTCHDGDVSLTGTLSIPSSGSPRHPAVVFVHGSGAGPREAFSFWADQLTRLGVAALVFDKRGSGASTGNWRDADFNDLASDVLACVEVLTARTDIDPQQIGLFGQSQGGWVAPLAASRSRDIAWLILVSGTPVTPAAQTWWEAESRLRKRGVQVADIATARAFWQLNDEVTRTGQRFAELRAAAAKARHTSWFAALQVPPTPPAVDAPVRVFLRRIIDFDPLPVLRNVSSPSLWIYGAKDETVPAAESAAILEGLKSQGKDITVRTFPDATHALWVVASQPSFRWMSLAPGYVDTIKEWLSDRLRASR